MRGSSLRVKKLCVEPFVYLHHLLVGEAAVCCKFGDGFEVMILSTRQGPVEHAPGSIADVLEAVHDVARDEDDGAGAGRRGLAADGDFIGAFDDEEYFFLVEMDVISRALTGFDPSHEDRDSATGSFGGKEYFHVEAERLDR